MAKKKSLCSMADRVILCTMKLISRPLCSAPSALIERLHGRLGAPPMLASAKEWGLAPSLRGACPHSLAAFTFGLDARSHLLG